MLLTWCVSFFLFVLFFGFIYSADARRLCGLFLFSEKRFLLSYGLALKLNIYPLGTISGIAWFFFACPRVELLGLVGWLLVFNVLSSTTFVYISFGLNKTHLLSLNCKADQIVSVGSFSSINVFLFTNEHPLA